MATLLSRKASMARDDKNAAKKKARMARSKKMNELGKAQGLQRSGSDKSTGKASYSTKTKTWRMK